MNHIIGDCQWIVSKIYSVLLFCCNYLLLPWKEEWTLNQDHIFFSSEAAYANYSSLEDTLKQGGSSCTKLLFVFLKCQVAQDGEAGGGKKKKKKDLSLTYCLGQQYRVLLGPSEKCLWISQYRADGDHSIHVIYSHCYHQLCPWAIDWVSVSSPVRFRAYEFLFYHR